MDMELSETFVFIFKGFGKFIHIHVHGLFMLEYGYYGKRYDHTGCEFSQLVNSATIQCFFNI